MHIAILLAGALILGVVVSSSAYFFAAAEGLGLG
jgi:hypothetical protein